MDEIFDLKFHKPQNEILPCAKEAIVVTEFAIFQKRPPFYEVNNDLEENGFGMEEFQKMFFLDHFSPS